MTFVELKGGRGEGLSDMYMYGMAVSTPLRRAGVRAAGAAQRRLAAWKEAVGVLERSGGRRDNGRSDDVRASDGRIATSVCRRV